MPDAKLKGELVSQDDVTPFCQLVGSPCNPTWQGHSLTWMRTCGLRGIMGPLVPPPNVTTLNGSPFVLFPLISLFDWPVGDRWLSLACWGCWDSGSDPDDFYNINPWQLILKIFLLSA